MSWHVHTSYADKYFFWDRGFGDTLSFSAIVFVKGHALSAILSTGDYRTGDYRTGDYRTGDYRTGDYRTGDYRTGDYRTGDYRVSLLFACR
ncbi:hypothetical protein JCM17380_44010 [Desulfosporosinus burensis]